MRRHGVTTALCGLLLTFTTLSQQVGPTLAKDDQKVEHKPDTPGESEWGRVLPVYLHIFCEFHAMHMHIITALIYAVEHSIMCILGIGILVCCGGFGTEEEE